MAEKTSPKADALTYLAEASRLAKLPAPTQVERVQLRSFIEMATENVTAIHELKRAPARKATEPASA